MAKGVTTRVYSAKPKRRGKAKKSWGPKECRPAAYRGQGR